MKSSKNILIAFLLNLIFSIIEFVGGALSLSMAIMSDAIHDLGDSVSIGVAYFLEKKSVKKPDEKHTYGYLRFSVFGAFITNVILLVGSVFVIYESIKRFVNPVNVNPWIMFGLSIFAILVNGYAAIRTSKGKGLNEKSINLHMLEDVLGWIVVFVGSIVMLIFKTSIIDSIMSLLVTIFILYNVVKNFVSMFKIFMQETPEGFDTKEFLKSLESVKGVENVHHLHVWTIDGQNILASFHAVVECDEKEKIIKIKKSLERQSLKYDISHITIQIDYQGEKCVDPHCDMKPIEEEHKH